MNGYVVTVMPEGEKPVTVEVEAVCFMDATAIAREQVRSGCMSDLMSCTQRSILISKLPCRAVRVW